ncbi:hypothetical protein [Silvanigrella aquatica]|uniref:Uncharacterized protein n=1 Tax=Silvanigrella aquatica TaxID=1915309 RepID=A0A1L4CYG3_9BACT|nr:hypothetical protein [Silvanigrella aquatica]APJ02992.1 hypothetical protein AXG55_03305 [Silvanigrella aquatica]
MSFDLQKHNVAVHASRVTKEFRKAIHSEPGVSTVKHAFSPRQLHETSCAHLQAIPTREDCLLLSDSRIYALKKRLLAPSWWVEGVLLSLGAKEAWFDSLISKRTGRLIAAPSSVNAKNISLMFAIWHEALSQIFSSKNDEMVLRFQINKYLIGTQKDVLDSCKQLESIWATPLNLYEIKPAKKSRSLSLSRSGSLGLIRHAQIENDVDGIWFSLSLSQSLKSFYSQQQKTDSNSAGLNSSFISINPVVIQSMGRKASIKKILNYLFLEYAKQENSHNQINNWNSIPIDSKNITSFHKDILVNVPSLYDHGVLGWNISAPNVKLSELKNKILVHSEEGTEASHGAIVYCWQLSDQAKEAFELEQAISEKLMSQLPQTYYNQSNHFSLPLVKVTKKVPSEKTLFPEPPPDELKKARNEKKLKILKSEKIVKEPKKVNKRIIIDKEELIEKKVTKRAVSQTLFDSIDNNVVQEIKMIPVKKEIIKKKVVSVKEVLSDNDFIILVSEFYESLKPLQKKAFERERAGMTPEQFRVYMTPILKRKKTIKNK